MISLKKWQVVAEDDSEETYAVINHKPLTNSMYKVEVIVEEFYEGYSAARYGLMYVHD